MGSGPRMKMGKAAAGKAPLRLAVKICKVEILDGAGASRVPAVFQFWIATISIPPQVLSVHDTLEEALREIEASGYSLSDGVPSP